MQPTQAQVESMLRAMRKAGCEIAMLKALLDNNEWSRRVFSDLLDLRTAAYVRRGKLRAQLPHGMIVRFPIELTSTRRSLPDLIA